MKDDNYQEELLVELARCMKANYVSDLITKVGIDEFKRVVERIPESRYDVQQWQEAIEYLTYRSKRNDETFSSVTEAKQYLMSIFI